MVKLSDKNRLSIVRPELSKEWDYEKNYPLTPDGVSCGSGIKVWWKCKYGHEWEAAICDRTHGHKCPYCSRNKLSDNNRLSKVNPELSKEWNSDKNNSTTPDQFAHNSNKKVWWKCKFGHEWEAKINNRSTGLGCPYCSGRNVSDKNKLSLFYPDLCKEWDFKKNHPLTPDSVSFGTHKKVWWKCEKGHEWRCQVYSRVDGNGCPFCSNREIDKNNCLAALNAYLAREWHPIKNGSLTPYDVPRSSKIKVWWKCKKNHEWKATINHRSNGTNCPYCRKVELNDGSILDSLVEAYLYLKLKNRGFKIEIGKNYTYKNYKCDFYLPEINTYIEVTSFKDGDFKYCNMWKKYYSKILDKKEFVERVLGAKFRFIQFCLNPARIRVIRQNSS